MMYAWPVFITHYCRAPCYYCLLLVVHGVCSVWLVYFFFRQRIKQPNREKGRRIPRPAGKGRNGRPVGICSVTNAAGAAKRRRHELVGGSALQQAMRGLVTSQQSSRARRSENQQDCMHACLHSCAHRCSSRSGCRRAE